MFACSVICSHGTLAPTRGLLKFDQFEVWLKSDKSNRHFMQSSKYIYAIGLYNGDGLCSL